VLLGAHNPHSCRKSPVRNVVALKEQTPQQVPEERDGLALVPLFEANIDRPALAVSDERGIGPRLSVVVPAMN
jgi:hypothetical protein